jgi:hypothetical protein
MASTGAGPDPDSRYEPGDHIVSPRQVIGAWLVCLVIGAAALGLPASQGELTAAHDTPDLPPAASAPTSGTGFVVADRAGRAAGAAFGARCNAAMQQNGEQNGACRR